jgi:hypothetical protein
VRHDDPLFLDPGPGPPGAVNALKDKLLADRPGQRLRRPVMLEPGNGVVLAQCALVLAQGLLHPARARGVASAAGAADARGAGGHEVLASLTLVLVSRP